MTGSFGKIAVGVPYYKGVPEFWLSWTMMLVQGQFQPGDRVLNTLGPDGRPNIEMGVRLPLAHNKIIREFLLTDCDTLCIIEDDHGFRADQLNRMRFKPANQEFDIVCADYVNRRVDARMQPCGWWMPETVESRGGYMAGIWLNRYERTGTQAVDGAAFGFSLHRRWVLEAMCGDNDPEEFMWADCVRGCSPDMPFYYQAHDVGATVGVDRDNGVIHVGSYRYSVADGWAWLDEQLERLGQEQNTEG